MADPAYIVDGVLTDGEAWVALASTTLGSDTASITFTSPDDGSSLDWSQFVDLVAICYGRNSRTGVAAESFTFQLNDDTSASYAFQYLSGDGSATAAGSGTGRTYGYFGAMPAATATANAFGASITHFFDINSGKFKSILQEFATDRDGAGGAAIYATVWQKQAPIIKLYVYGAGSNMVAGTRLDLFGILPRMVA
jgi:hypothetical protein